MRAHGKISDSGEAKLAVWQPAQALTEPDSEEVRLCVGFLRADLSKFFGSFADDWLSLFHVLDVKVDNFEVQTVLEFPEDLERVMPIEVDGEAAVIGLDAATEKCLLDMVSKQYTDAGADIIIEYLERRFISTLCKSWSGSAPLNAVFIPQQNERSVEVVGVVKLFFKLANTKCVVCVGLGPRLLSLLDRCWRDYVVQSQKTQVSRMDAKKERHVSFQLAEIAVPPAMLIDYLKAGTLIDLEVPVSDAVTLRLDGRKWASGRLCQFKGKFAVQIVDFDIRQSNIPSGNTHIQIEIAGASLDERTLLEHSSPRVYILTEEVLSPTASLIIGGEKVAEATIVEVNSRFALNVLPK